MNAQCKLIPWISLKNQMNDNNAVNFRLRFLFWVSLICVVLTFVVNGVYHIDVVYTHLFYIPIILAGIWYPQYAIFFAAALGLLHITCDYAAAAAFKIDPFLRATILVIVACVTSYLVLWRNRSFKRLQTANDELASARNDLYSKNEKLQNALNEVKTLKGLLPICASCKKIRDDKGYWNQIEFYLQNHMEVRFSHGLCPECKKKLYPEFT